jgi:hypothetical protein
MPLNTSIGMVVVLRMVSSLWCRIGPVLSPIPGQDGAADARGYGDVVVEAESRRSR